MNSERFDELVKAQMRRSESMLLTKAREYAENATFDNETDRLAHFKKAGALMSETPKKAAFGMLVKHLVSVSDMASSGKEYPLSQWNEKITDSINYLLIIRAIVEEEESMKSKTISKPSNLKEETK